MTEDPARRSREARVEAWIANAKKLLEASEETRALELYRQAADELPGAPWLQHRTAELARRLKQRDVAIAYFRRAATAFQIADFLRRAVPPLRTAWLLALEGLPASSRALVDVAGELIQLQRRLGHASDASVTFERTNGALRGSGFSELGSQLLTAAPQPLATTPPRAPPGPGTEAPPASGTKPAINSSGPPTPRARGG